MEIHKFHLLGNPLTFSSPAKKEALKKELERLEELENQEKRRVKQEEKAREKAKRRAEFEKKQSQEQKARESKVSCNLTSKLLIISKTP